MVGLQSKSSAEEGSLSRECRLAQPMRVEELHLFEFGVHRANCEVDGLNQCVAHSLGGSRGSAGGEHGY